jgi:hypothetical protein
MLDPGPHLNLRSAAIVGEQVAIRRKIAVAEEGSGAAIATLGEVMRVTGNYDTGHAA